MYTFNYFKSIVIAFDHGIILNTSIFNTLSATMTYTELSFKAASVTSDYITIEIGYKTKENYNAFSNL